MRLAFSVLWFDDNEDYFDSLDLEPLRTEILSWGFWPQIKQVTTPKEFNECSPFDSYDLIIVDRNLEDYASGQEFIADIRENAVYTEVIFYTAGNTGDLWEAIHDKKLEGVFVSSRNSILSKIAKVGRQSVRKVLDLENMRGIVMAEVGELDRLLDEIMSIGFNHLTQEQQVTIFSKFHERAAKQNQDNGKYLTEFLNDPTVARMIELSDSNKRWQNFNQLRKAHKKLKNEAKVGNYEEDILHPRNSLAHGTPVLENGVYHFHHRGTVFLFDENTSLRLRQTILRYKRKFSDIKVLLNSDY